MREFCKEVMCLSGCELFLTITVPPALTSFLTSYLSAYFLRKNDDKNKLDTLNKERRNLAKALHTEISTLVKMYDKMKLENKLPEKGSDIKVAFISQNYIAVYENNLDKLGILESEDISYIVEFYMYCKSLIDSLKYLAQRWEQYVSYQRKNYPTTDKNIADELHRKYIDVKTAYEAALAGQEKVFTLHRNILERLEKY